MGKIAPRFALIHFRTSVGLPSNSLSHFVEWMLSLSLPCQNSLTISSFQLAHPVAGRRILEDVHVETVKLSRETVPVN
jgi:hypothetical protein